MEKIKHFGNLKLITLLSLVVIIGFLSSCSQKKKQPVSFAFYNVENLFDTIDDPTISDERYLPESEIPWNNERYQHKLDNLTKVMSSVDSSGFPTIFGLCEVENIYVLQDLVNHPVVKKANYQILHKNSPDERGIDVALLYQKEFYTPVETKYIRIRFPFDTANKTRDILYSKGFVEGSDTLHIFINHWTSRWGGQEATEANRQFIGETLKIKTDSILKAQPKASIIIAGDLNDNPTDISVKEKLGALPVTKPIIKTSLYNLSLSLFNMGEGTLYYKSWDMFDQIIVSGNMLEGRGGIKVETIDQVIIKHDWMLYQPKEGPARPSRTAAGRYYGGYSDHLPVFIRMTAN